MSLWPRDFVADPMFFGQRALIQALMQAERLPIGYQVRAHIHAGGLLSYASSLMNNYLHAAKFADQILKGAKPADLPVERTNNFEPVVNLRAAETLGISLAQAVLLPADIIID